jgi:uncharacterized protein YabN with tetrapyrrole methylase and pyrophosphatase domain
VRSSLTVVGTGIQLAAHLTPEARAALVAADEVLYLMGDVVALLSLERLNPNSRSLQGLYAPGRPRSETYAAVVEEILAAVRRGGNICVALYGHPGVFAQPAHEAVRQARLEGFAARMLPGVSAEDCLFADLGVDPGANGCQSYEASDFLLRRRRIDTSAALILWQIAVVGNFTYAPEGDLSRLPVLVACLCDVYPPKHEVVLYEASPFPGCGPIIQRVRLAELLRADVSAGTTLYVPPATARRSDREMVSRLGTTPGAPASSARRDS